MDRSDKVVRPGRGWKRATIVMLMLGPPAALLLTGFLLLSKAKGRLERAMAQADRLDPGWKFADLQAKRANLPDAENAAVRVLEVCAKIPGNWLASVPSPVKGAPTGPPRGNELLGRLKTVSPRDSLPEDLRVGLIAEMAALRPAVDRARTLAGMRQGRYPIPVAGDFVSTSRAHLAQARQVGRLLQLDVMARADAGDIDGALDSCRAILATARSVGDEPQNFSQLVRIALEAVGLQALERTLGQGQGSDAALAAVQHELARDVKEPLLLASLRGERAYLLVSFEGIRAMQGGNRWDVLGGASQGLLHYNEGICLEVLTGAVEMAKHSVDGQAAEWSHWSQQVRPPDGVIARRLTTLAFTAVPACELMARSYFQSRAHLQSSLVLIAVERHRLRVGHWPAVVEDLAGAFPEGLPRDPYRDGPIRIARRERGVAAYSVGADRKDDGGTFHPKNVDQAGMDLGRTVWDVERRRQPPSAGEPAEGP